MSNYSALLTQINAHIKQNGNQEITGNILNAVLRAMVSELGKGYRYGGVAIPSATPGTNPNYPVFYICKQAGTYAQFGGIELGDGEVAVVTWDGDEWNSDTILDLSGYATTTDLTSLAEIVDNIDVNLIPALQESVEGLAEDKADKSTTYTKTEVNTLLGAKANDNAVMHLAGAETITGGKTFTEIVNFEDPVNADLINVNQLTADDGMTISPEGSLILTATGDVQISAEGEVKVVSEAGTISDVVSAINDLNGSLDSLSGDVTTLFGDMEGKASQSDLDALSEVVGNVNDLLETI